MATSRGRNTKGSGKKVAAKAARNATESKPSKQAAETPIKARTTKRAAKKASKKPSERQTATKQARRASAAPPQRIARSTQSVAGRPMSELLLTPTPVEQAVPRWKSLAATSLARSVAMTAGAEAAPTVEIVPPRRVLSFAAGLRAVIETNEHLSARVDQLVNSVTFTVAPRTRSGTPIQSLRGQVSSLSDEGLNGVRPEDSACDRAVCRLESLGFRVLRRGRFGITAEGAAELVADAMGTELQVMAQPGGHRPRSVAMMGVSDAGLAPTPSRVYLAPARSLSLRSRVSESIDHFVFTPPPVYFAPVSSTPPMVNWHRVDEKAVRSLLCVGAGAPTGAGVRVAIIDTGFYPHPYYAQHNVRRITLPTSGNPAVDDVGHGTAILYNLVSVAPDAEVLAIAQSNPTQDGIEAAFFDEGAEVISCSWGFDNEISFPIVEATIRDVVRNGGIVLFAAGNGHHAWPGSMPDVLSIGGVYADPQHQLEASNFASGFMSSLYPNRRVPDVCGLCGQIPQGIYILMPTQPGCEMDVNLGSTPYDEFDETSPNDGWCGASGTSSATPQVAGIVALMLEAAKARGNKLTPADARSVLEASAQPVTAGRNAFGFPAAGVPNTATGFGLVDFSRALAELQARGLA